MGGEKKDSRGPGARGCRRFDTNCQLMIWKAITV
jgi:hypothetical protein